MQSKADVIDNKDLIRASIIEHGFSNPGDFFIVHIFQRQKDGNPRDRILVTKFVYSPEYWDERIEEWIETAEQNNARIYINPSRRNNATVLRQMAKDCIDMMGDPNYVLNDFVRSSACSCHKTDDRRWIVDLDCSDLGEGTRVDDQAFQEHVERVKSYILNKNPEASVTVVRTPNGSHILTKPFDLRDFYDPRHSLCHVSDVKLFSVEKVKKDDFTLVFFKRKMDS